MTLSIGYFRLGLVVLFLLLLFAGSSLAQVTTADLLGTVTDQSGGILANATVTIKSAATGATRSMPTTSTGNYAFTSLQIGSYSVTVEASGFKTFLAPSVTLAAGDRVRMDAKMEIGTLSETVEVSAESIAVLQTDSATIGGLVTDKAVQDLPVNGRNFIKLAQLMPGATESSQSSLQGGGRPDDRRQTSAVSVNGQPDSLNNYLIDGMDNNERSIGTIGVKPSIDALAEVKIQSNLYSADIGRAAAGVINMITKSGTNSFHGSLFEFLRNDIFDAKDYFNVPQAGNPYAGVKPKYRQNQYGGSIGGPIMKDKLFFFGDYEGLRIVQGKTGQTILPTACELGKAECNGVTQLGNFSDWGSSMTIYDPTTNPPTAFANNIIPLSRINSISANYAAMVPALPAEACNPSTHTCTFVNSPVRTQFAHSFDVRIDYIIGQNDHFFGRYSFNNTDTLTPGILPQVTVAGIDVYPGGNSGGATGGDMFPGFAHQRQQQFGLSYVHTFSPSLLMELAAGVLRFVTDSQPLNFGKDVNTAFGGPNVNNGIESSGLATVQFSNGGYGGLGDAMFLPTRYWDTTYQYKGQITWTRGAHILKMGAALIRPTWSQYQSQYPKGAFAFHSYQTNSAEGGAGGTGGNSYASFLLGYLNTTTRNAAMVSPQYRRWEPSVFIQDDWRVNSKLTLNLGIRYDVFTMFVEKHNQIASFDSSNPDVVAGKLVQNAGVDGVSRSVGVSTEYKDFQPRFGFAYMPGNGMVVRGGFGMTYYPNTVGSPTQMKNFPFVSNISVPTTLGAPGTDLPEFGDPLPPLVGGSRCLDKSCGTTTKSIAVPGSVDQDLKNGVVYQFNLMVEKEFAGNILTLGYIGSITKNQGRNPNMNQPLPPLGPGGCGLTTVMNFPNPCQPLYSSLPQVNTTSLFQSNAMNVYNGAQVIFQRRYRAGLTFTTSYTYGRALANAIGPEGGFGGQNVVPQYYDFYDWGNSYYDVRHRWSLTANYELPFGQSLKGAAGQVVKGWQVNLITLYSTGNPFTVLNASSPQQNTGISADRPNRLPQGDFVQSVNQWFDYTAFAKQPWGTAGNEGANQFYAPSMQRIDFSVFKTFPLSESIRLQFRFEAFNLFNMVSLGIPNATIQGWDSAGKPTQAGNFGKITGTNVHYTPRDLQFALKLLF